jgi:transporter family protein
MQASWQVWAIGSAIFAAMTAILAKIGVADVPSDLATLIRTVVILALVAGIVLVTGQFSSLPSVTGRTWLFLALSGMATGLSWLCYFRALKLGDAARVAPIDKLSVVFVAIFAVLFLGEHLTLPNWVGVAMMAGGAILLAWR